MGADPVFLRLDGEWPLWYRGVLLLYSAEIAVNHLIDKERLYVRGDLLDTCEARCCQGTCVRDTVGARVTRERSCF